MNVTMNELHAFMGILLAAGRNHGRRLHITGMWCKGKLFKQPFFTAAMPCDRYKEIFRNIRFDEPTTRAERIENTKDKLQAIRTLYDQFTQNCIRQYSLGANITVDERLATFRGKCTFRVYMKSKLVRYGIRIWVCADSKTEYVLTPQVYTGMIDGQREKDQGKRVVLDLIEPHFGTWRGLTTDNFFTSIPLAEQSFRNKLTFTETMRSNKREIPKEFLAHPSREEFSSLFDFSDNKTIVSYVPKKNKSVILLSTQFNGNYVSDEETNFKPEIILHNNKIKRAVDTGDKMTHEYSCVRACRRWPLRIFMEMIDVAALNAYIVWSKKYPEWRKKIVAAEGLSYENYSFSWRKIMCKKEKYIIQVKTFLSNQLLICFEGN
ncbi:hypothetical protein JTB14_036057 [Gonioctena quinquepunctata]|nr:hypothetical protein JTB14_036057 [Gonioctena quinquepunctata]